MCPSKQLTGCVFTFIIYDQCSLILVDLEAFTLKLRWIIQISWKEL